jgi:DNA (cytosine-5)-methyltransferase 1
MTVYFNEFDSYPAQWLRNLYPSATVDDRSIKDVRAVDTTEYLRCHFFAGIGGWEYALKLAGWGDIYKGFSQWIARGLESFLESKTRSLCQKS